MTTEDNAAKILVIGVDPLKLDPAEWGVTAEHNAAVRDKIAASERALREAGYAASFCLIALDEALDETLSRRIQAEPWDCVVIGGGIRTPPQLLGLFEEVVNAVHRHAPQAAIAFNDRPDDVLETVARRLARRRQPPGSGG